MLKAQAVWRLWPRQIASDLHRFFQVDIADWHQGRLSSFKLLELFGASVEDDPQTQTRTISVDFAPQDGALDRAMREGGYTRLEQLVAEAHNEIARFRASYHTVSSRGKSTFEPFEFLDPRVEKARDAEKREREEFQKQAEEALFEGLDW